MNVKNLAGRTVDLQKDVADFLKSNPESAKEGQKLVAEGIAAAGKFAAENPEVIGKTLSLIANPELHKFAIKSAAASAPLVVNSLIKNFFSSFQPLG